VQILERNRTLLFFFPKVMLSASYWSLLKPAIELTIQQGYTWIWLPSTSGILSEIWGFWEKS